MVKTLLLSAAYLCCVVGWGWVALAMESHWQQLRGAQALPAPAARTLRALGAAGVLAALGLCLRADRPSMAALVWVMTLAAAALTVTLTLSWRPRALAPLVAWVPRGTQAGSAETARGR
jgi:hypothetical protein